MAGGDSGPAATASAVAPDSSARRVRSTVIEISSGRRVWWSARRVSNAVLGPHRAGLMSLLGDWCMGSRFKLPLNSDFAASESLPAMSAAGRLVRVICTDEMA